MSRYTRVRWKRILFRGGFHRRVVRSTRRLRHSRSKVARVCSSILLSIAWIVLPLLPGCSRRPANPTEIEPVSSRSPAPVPVDTVPPADSGRTIQFRGLDNDYRGTTRIMPNHGLIHGRDQND